MTDTTQPETATPASQPEEGKDARWANLWGQVEPQRVEYFDRDGVTDVVIDAMSEAGFGIEHGGIQAALEVGYLLALREVDDRRQMTHADDEPAAHPETVTVPIEGVQGERAGSVSLPLEVAAALSSIPDSWHLCPVTVWTAEGAPRILAGFSLAPIPVRETPEVRASTSEVVRVAQGHGMRFRAHDGSTVIVRLATGPEMLEQHREACVRNGTEPSLTLDQATDFVRPLPEANR